ncbi:NADPH:quinone reductase [bacterium CPR1]|nr:NADPH:quinone reductase [bacterium CPR1]
MRAIVVNEFGEPEVMKVQERPDPVPGPDQVLVEVHATGVNPVDIYIRSGKYGRLPQLPYTPGTDAAGVVRSGPGFEPGARVYLAGSLTGTCAELALCAPEQVHPLPESTSFEQGAGLYVPYGTAYRALFLRAHARPGETVLVHGASGGVGQAAVQWARAAGLTVLGTASTEPGLDLVRRLGAHHVFNHAAPGYLDELRALRPNLILEMLANVNLENDLSLLAPRGRVVVIGSRGKIEIDPRWTMTGDLTLLGLSLANASPEEMGQIHAAIRAGLECAILSPVVGKTFSLEEAPAAHRAVMQGGAFGKVVLRTTSSPARC